MASNNNHTPILPPSTPTNARTQSHQMSSQQRDSNLKPSSDPRMNPPSVPRSLMTPAREMRESSVLSAAGSSARKPRQNLDERDHLLMLKHCHEHRHNFKEGTKAQFWNGVNAAFQQDTGKVLAQMSATVGRLVESRRRPVADWENGVIPQKPGGELNDALDQWIEYLKVEDGDAEAERMRQVDARRKIEEARKEARRQAIAAEQLAATQDPGVRIVSAPSAQQQEPRPVELAQPHQEAQGGEHAHTNGEAEMNGYRPHKRKRRDERSMARELQAQQDLWQAQQSQHAQIQHQAQQLQHAPPMYAPQPPPSPPRRVVVEGALTKEDWRDIMGNDARLRALEGKVDKIELLVSQNNKLLLQLVQNQNSAKERDRERSHEEDRVPVHLDAEFERDYLTGRYSKTPLPIN